MPSDRGNQSWSWVALLLVAVAGAGRTPAGRAHELSLEQRLLALEAEMQALRSGAPPLAPSQTYAVVPMAESPPATEVSWSLSRGGGDGLCLSSAGGGAGYPSVKLGGFFQTDFAWFYQDAINRETVGNIQDGADFRRARLNAHGDVWENVGFMVEFDFGFPGRPSFMDVYLDVRSLPAGTLRFGQWRQPFGMDGLTSVKELTFLERALPFAFLPFRQVGVGLFDTALDENVTWAISGFRFPTDVFGANIGDSGGYGLATRWTALPWYNEYQAALLHVGAGYVFANPSNNVVRYRNQPEIFISETGGADLVPAGVPTFVPPFVDTGPIPTQNFHMVNGELAGSWGSLYFQSEAYLVAVNRRVGQAVNFSGAYAQAGYFLTGETRPYQRQGGVFGRVVPNDPFGLHRGWGAWEVACRVSYLDLDDRDVQGGRLTDTTVGLNWYLNRYTKFQFNYIHAFLRNPTFGPSDADIFALRGQVDF